MYSKRDNPKRLDNHACFHHSFIYLLFVYRIEQYNINKSVQDILYAERLGTVFSDLHKRNKINLILILFFVQRSGEICSIEKNLEVENPSGLSR